MEKKAKRRAAEALVAAGEGGEVEAITEEEEKRRREELQKESDLRLAMETFGVGVEGAGLDSMRPQSEDEFSQFKDALADKIIMFEVSLVW